MTIPRLQLFELEDQPWFPALVRNLATDYLRFMQSRLRLHLHALPILARAVEASDTKRIVDLGSGSGGPVFELVRGLREMGLDVGFILTDLYPNVTGLAEVCRQSDGSIDFFDAPVDARRVPPELEGLRTFFNSFHHFGPKDARAILAGAAESGQPVAVFEIPERSIKTMLLIPLTPIFVWLATPFIRPMTWRRMVFTYLIPAVPVTCLWDGIVSLFRAYHPRELKGMADGLGANEFVWEAGTHRAPTVPGRLTYLIGWPA